MWMNFVRICPPWAMLSGRERKCVNLPVKMTGPVKEETLSVKWTALFSIFGLCVWVVRHGYDGVYLWLIGFSKKSKAFNRQPQKNNTRSYSVKYKFEYHSIPEILDNPSKRVWWALWVRIRKLFWKITTFDLNCVPKLFLKTCWCQSLYDLRMHASW